MRSARRLTGLALALAAGGAAAARAQTADQPNLILTISAGYLTGGSLWAIDHQLVPALQTGGYLWDTLALARRLRPGIAATLAATYFRSPHLGYTVEAGFFGIGTEARCAPVGSYAPDPDSKNQQACQFLQGENIRGNLVGFLAGLVWRFTTRGTQPYIRAAAGGAILGNSYVETWAPILYHDAGDTLRQGNLFILQDSSQGKVTWMVSLGAGATLPLASGYQLRVEVRDLITALPVPTGAIRDTIAIIRGTPIPPTAWKVIHVPTITVGLDVVLERRRGRRY